MMSLPKHTTAMFVHLCFLFIGVGLFSTGAVAFHWSPSSPQNNAVLYICPGNDAILPWSFNDSDSETIIDVQWYFKGPGQRQEVLATNVGGQFFTHNQQVQRVPPAGLRIAHFNASNDGVYSINVNTRNTSRFSMLYERLATVHSVVVPVLAGSRLRANLRPGAVHDDRSGRWFVQLQCGDIVSLGQPPLSVLWTDPSGQTFNSSGFDNGTFLLNLYEPVESGTYSCQIDSTTAPGRCLDDANLLRPATENVHSKDARLAILEVQQRELTNQVQKLQQQGQLQNTRIRQLEAEKAQCQGNLTNLQEKNRQLEANVTALEEEDRQLHGNLVSLQGEYRQSRVNVTSMHASNHQLAEENRQLQGNVTSLQEENADLADSLQQCQEYVSVTCGQPLIRDCVEAGLYNNQSGVITIRLRDNTPVDVYCDQDTDGGGWIVFQRRMDGSVDFYRNWTDYQNGFGNLQGDFWLGLDAIHALTSTRRRQELRVDLTDWNSTSVYAVFSNFSIGGSSDNYTLYLDRYMDGAAGDSLSQHKNRPFTTKDVDNDGNENNNCAVDYHGAWWYDISYNSNLNGEYKTANYASVQDSSGIAWNSFHSYLYSQKFVEMKMRPV